MTPIPPFSAFSSIAPLSSTPRIAGLKRSTAPAASFTSPTRWRKRSTLWTDVSISAPPPATSARAGSASQAAAIPAPSTRAHDFTCTAPIPPQPTIPILSSAILPAFQRELPAGGVDVLAPLHPLRHRDPLLFQDAPE